MSAIRAVVLIASVVLIVAPAFAEVPESVSAMKWQKRVVLAASPVAGDANLAAQQRILEAWRSEAASRDGFRAVLIGKDGKVALRSDKPIASATLQRAIDAMPMRQAGER